MSQTIYSTAGTFTWTCPDGITSVDVECWGAGAGGGKGSDDEENPLDGNGGGGGAYSKKLSIAVTPGNGYTVVVGVAGNGGNVGNGGSGGDTYFISTGTVLAKGGNGPSPFAGGAAASGVGDTKFSGGNGSNFGSPPKGGGGSSAGTASNGNNDSGSSGGAAPSGGGAGGNRSAAGSAPGGGGGGGNLAGNGSAGAPGKVIITYAGDPPSFVFSPRRRVQECEEFGATALRRAILVPASPSIVSAWVPMVRRLGIPDEPERAIPARRLITPPRAPIWLPSRRRVRIDEEPVIKPAPRPRWIQELFARELILAQALSARAGFLMAHAQDLNAFIRAGYRLLALNLETSEESDLGFIAADGPLNIAGVSLADGHYEIRVRAFGHWWQHAQFNTVFPITIEDGETIEPLPAILNLAYAIDGETVYLSWSWQLTAGYGTPDDFAIWIASSEPLDTSGAPSYVIPANAPGAVTTTISGGTPGEFVAVCSRRDDTKGPVSTIHIESADAAIASPENQRVRYPFS